MKIAIRENYIDTNALERFTETKLSQDPYNFSFCEIPNDKQDCAFEDFDLIGGEYLFNATKYNARKNAVINSNRIAELKHFLDTEWRWKWERFNAETDEIALGLRESTTQTREELILARKNAVDEINELEG